MNETQGLQFMHVSMLPQNTEKVLLQSAPSIIDVYTEHVLLRAQYRSNNNNIIIGLKMEAARSSETLVSTC